MGGTQVLSGLSPLFLMLLSPASPSPHIGPIGLVSKLHPFPPGPAEHPSTWAWGSLGTPNMGHGHVYVAPYGGIQVMPEMVGLGGMMGNMGNKDGDKQDKNKGDKKKKDEKMKGEKKKDKEGGGHSWNYERGDKYGPSNWSNSFPDCGLERQSPINIPGTGLPRVTDFPPLKLEDYDRVPEMAVLLNNGHSAKISFKSEREKLVPMMSGGGLKNKYKFAQLHFHWGADDSRGSEHTISSTSFPLELHLVHYKATHSNILEALEEGAHDSLAVLGIMFSVQPDSQVNFPTMDILGKGLANITEAKMETVVDPFPLSSLLPQDLSEFYRYSGSLTTPTCNQIVQWTLLKNPVSITQAQMRPFRELLTKKGEKIVDNYRPVQPLGSRTILDVSTSSDPQLFGTDALIRATNKMALALDAVTNALSLLKSRP